MFIPNHLHLIVKGNFKNPPTEVDVLNNWFKKPQYKDVLDYIHSVNCHYRFNELPMAWLGLPTKK